VSEPRLLTRDQFREGVFARDGHRCVFCGATAEQTPEGKLDAHHIVERRLWPDGGYYLDNGATVCEAHHLLCEQTVLSVEQVREAAGITRVLVPDQFYPEQPITKWGDYVLEDGRRTRGELFHDESVQRVLARGGVLDRYTPYVKYGRTMHLPWSPGIHDDDKALRHVDGFVGQDVVITTKMDGENTKGYSDGHVHARSIDSRGGEDRAWVKKFLVDQVCFNLPEGWHVAGENLWAEHSIRYDDLPSYFLGFSLWDERATCLSWDETLEYFELLGVTPVPTLWRGVLPDNAVDATRVIRAVERKLDLARDEGYVVRLARAFAYGEFQHCVAKFVRAGHIKTAKHWRAGRAFTPNGLARETT
jgi:hypothetical protein